MSATMSARSTAGLAALRARVRAIERGGGARPETVMPLGVAALDHGLAGGGLALGRVHEVLGEARRDVRDAAPFGFTAALLVRLLRQDAVRGDVLWCVREANMFGGPPSARGLLCLGLDPGRIILVRARDEADRLWAMEEGLGASGIAAVVAELGPSRAVRGERESVACRRLQLAAEAGGATGFLLRPDAGTAMAATTPESRWRVRAAVSRTWAHDWAPRWEVGLLRARNGRPASATLSWDADTAMFRPAPAESEAQPRAAAPMPVTRRGGGRFAA